MYASLQTGAHLLAREIVSRLNLVSTECKNEVLSCLGENVNNMKHNKNGCAVLKALGPVME